MTDTAKAVYIGMAQDGLTKQLQIFITREGGSGYRIAGPKFNGSSKTLIRHQVTKRDADEIRKYLNYAGL